MKVTAAKKSEHNPSMSQKVEDEIARRIKDKAPKHRVTSKEQLKKHFAQ
jgi:F0F1-type ATP synthase assembly protein I